MQFLYDNLIATVIGMTVLLILIAIQLRATRANVAQTSRSIAFKHAETMATWLEEDLSQMGRNMDNKPFELLTTREENEDSPTGDILQPDDAADFEFEYKDGVGNQSTITYTMRSTDNSHYELERSRSNGGGSPTDAGGSPTELGYFDLEFIDENANPGANLDQIQAIRVHFSVVTPFQNDETTLQEIHRMVVVPYAPNQD